MRNSPLPIKLIRYLIVWRINRVLVWLPRYFALEISHRLGQIVANRLSTSEAAPWKKMLQPLQDYFDKLRNVQSQETLLVPDAAWPLHSAIFVYPGKKFFGKDELLLWELKLFGEHADHGQFLEIVLPAMEEAGYTTMPGASRDAIWGKFEVHAVYAARGLQWEPLVTNGRLDLQRNVTAAQWESGLDFTPPSQRFRQLHWSTPCDFREIDLDRQTSRAMSAPAAARRVKFLLRHLLRRIGELLPGRFHSPDEVLLSLDADTRQAFQTALSLADEVRYAQTKIRAASKTLPGFWYGTVGFTELPSALLPYLELASILHVGRNTHLGCGTFKLLTEPHKH